MGTLAAFAREHVLWAIITLSLLAGLIGAYGRERHEGRAPDHAWWISRACIMPFFAIVAAWAADQFGLNGQQSSLLSALLALMGYEAVRIIVDRARKQAGDTQLGGAHVATAKPYASFVETDDVGRPTAHIVVTPGEGKPTEVVGAVLRETYDRTAHEAPGDDMKALLRQLDQRSPDADSNPSPHPPVQPGQ